MISRHEHSVKQMIQIHQMVLCLNDIVLTEMNDIMILTLKMSPYK